MFFHTKTKKAPKHYLKLAILLLVLLCSGNFIALAQNSNNTQEKILNLDDYVGKAYVSEIVTSGNRLVTDQEILNEILSIPGTVFNKNMIVADLQKIYNMGYFQKGSVEAVPYLKEDKSILLEYRVLENPPITDITIYGNNDVDKIDAYDFFADMLGKPENAKLIKEQIQALETEYLKNGFIIAKVRDIDLNDSGEFKIFLDEGMVRSITYRGNNKTKKIFLDHLVRDQKVNQAYNEFDFANDFKRLQGSGYFSNITRTVKPLADGSGYDLIIDLNEKRTTSIGFGGGINSSAGVFGNASLRFGNLRGKGETLNVNAILGSGLGSTQTLANNTNLVRRDRFTSINASYSIPFFMESDYRQTTFASYTRGPNFNVDLARQNAYQVGAGVSRSVGKNHAFSLNASANYLDLEDRDRQEYISEVTDNIINEDKLTQKEVLDNFSGSDFTGGRRAIARKEARQLRNSQIVSGFYASVKPSYTYSAIDDPVNPRSGWRTRISSEPSYGLSDISSFTKLNASTTKYIPVGKESSFLFNVRAGTELWGDIPQFAAYRLGSASGIRGYRQFSDLGVGNKFAIATTEFRTPIYNVIPPVKKFNFTKNVNFALFADAGLIGGDVRLNRITNRLSQAAAIGFGLRVRLPLVGALRLDIGFPLIEALTGDKLFRFNFGPADIF